jgi:hypothetical protein
MVMAESARGPHHNVDFVTGFYSGLRLRSNLTKIVPALRESVSIFKCSSRL